MVRSKGGVSGVMIINLLVSAGLQSSRASQVAVVVKNPPVSAGDARDTGLIPGSGRSGEGNGNPLQCSRLENPMGRGAWWAIIHGVPKELDTT